MQGKQTNSNNINKQHITNPTCECN